MDLSGLESADAIDTKEIRAHRFRIVWDDMGSPLLRVVPVLFLPRSSTDHCSNYAKGRLCDTPHQLVKRTLGEPSPAKWHETRHICGSVVGVQPFCGIMRCVERRLVGREGMNSVGMPLESI